MLAKEIGEEKIKSENTTKEEDTVVEEEDIEDAEEEEDKSAMKDPPVVFKNHGTISNHTDMKDVGITAGISHIGEISRWCTWISEWMTKNLGESSSYCMVSAQRRRRTSDVSAQARRAWVKTGSPCTTRATTSTGSYPAS